MEWASESIIKKCQHTTQWWSYLRSERWRWKKSYKAIKTFKMTLPLIFVSKKTKSKMFRFNESFTRLSAAELANFNMVDDRWCFNRFDEISNNFAVIFKWWLFQSFVFNFGKNSFLKAQILMKSQSILLFNWF